MELFSYRSYPCREVPLTADKSPAPPVGRGSWFVPNLLNIYWVGCRQDINTPVVTGYLPLNNHTPFNITTYIP